MSPRLRIAVLVIAWLVDAAPGSSSELAVNLNWQGPRDCQDDGSVGREIRRIVGDSLPLPDNGLFVSALVNKTADGSWTVSLRTRVGNRTGERTLIGATCAEVRRATALIVALMINPNVRVDSTPPAREPIPPRPKPRPAPVDIADPLVPPSSSRDQRMELGLAALAGFGILPKPSAALEASAGVSFSALSLQLSGSAWFPRSTISNGSLGAGGEFTLFGAKLLACTRPLTGAQVGVCAGAGLRHMRGEGFGVSDPSQASATWAVAALEAFALLELARSLGLKAALGAEFPFRPPTFSLAGLGEVHSPAPVAGHAALGMLVRF